MPQGYHWAATGMQRLAVSMVGAARIRRRALARSRPASLAPPQPRAKEEHMSRTFKLASDFTGAAGGKD